MSFQVCNATKPSVSHLQYILYFVTPKNVHSFVCFLICLLGYVLPQNLNNLHLNVSLCSWSIVLERHFIYLHMHWCTNFISFHYLFNISLCPTFLPVSHSCYWSLFSQHWVCGRHCFRNQDSKTMKNKNIFVSSAIKVFKN